jgi:hypothetical protein
MKHEASDFIVRFESDASIGRRAGAINGTFWMLNALRPRKHFASITVFATISRA